MAETVSQWLSSVGCPDWLAIFIISLFPILELRGGLIAAAIMKMSWWQSFIICYIGNILPVPFILIFIKKIFELMKKFKPTRGFVLFFENRANKKVEAANGKVGIGRLMFVFWFVAIPLPGTGAWTGALIASFMNLKFKHSVITICLGVVFAGIIMLTLCFLFPAVFRSFFGISF